MGKLDTYTKDYVEDNTVFADVFNQFLYAGEQRITPELLRSVDSTEISIPYSGTDGTDMPSQRFRDKMKILSAKKDKSAVYLLLGLENQSEIHYAIPVKCMVYDAFQYASQVEKTAKVHRKERRKAKKAITSGEFLSGFYKEDRLIPVITLVIYFGTDEWDGPRSLSQMYAIPNEKLLPFMPEYKINLVSPQEMSDEEIGQFQTDFREVMMFCKYMKDKKKLQEIIDQDPEYRNMERSAARVIEAAANIELKIDESEEKINVCEGILGMIEDARREERERACEGIEGMIEDARREERKRACEGIEGMLEDARREERKRACEGIEGMIEDARREERERACKGIEGMIEDARREERERACKGIEGMIEDARREERERADSAIFKMKKLEDEKRNLYALIHKMQEDGRDKEIARACLDTEVCQLLLKEYGII